MSLALKIGYNRLLRLPNRLACRLKSTANDYEYDVAVLGGGPGGYVAAIKAAQLGMKTVCVEKNPTFGGTCLNVGCIPSKALLNASHHYHSLVHKDLEKFGIEHSAPSLNLKRMMDFKCGVVKSLTGGIATLLKANKVTPITGLGTIVGPNSILMKNSSNGETSTITAKNIIVATGSEVTEFPGIPIDEKIIVSSTGALSLEKVPKKMIIIGAGVIGLELGSVWSRLGSNVTMIEYMDHVGGLNIDNDVSISMEKFLKKLGIKFLLGKKVKSAKKLSDDHVAVQYVDKNNENEIKELECDCLLVCVGRRPNTNSIGLQNIGVSVDKRGFIQTDNNFRTSCPSVYAIGDCTLGPMLAHKAEDEGIACVECINNCPVHVNHNCIPRVIYTHPEVAWVGKTEEEIKELGVKYSVGKFPLVANGRSKCVGEAEGFVKVITDKESDAILGVHIIAPCAGEIINQMALVLEYNGSAEDVARVSHAHPTVAESIREACMSASFKKAIHSL